MLLPSHRAEGNTAVTQTSASDSAAHVASAVAESVQYHGRKASRQGSEQRRQAILDAAMRIIVRDGVRAVRHRAVAAEAAVPLSATTYYFKDINDLITDTFAQFVERSAAYMADFWGSTQGLLLALVGRLDGSAESRRELADEIARLAVEYVLQQLLTRRDHLMAEQAFEQ
ncbi:MAG: TetR/AcrR family transcriptional regulator, partial [Pseudomonas sp.]